MMFLRSLIAAACLVAISNASAQSTTLRPIYPTYQELKKTGYANDLFLKQVALAISRIDFGPPTEFQRLYRECVRTGAVNDCNAFLRRIEQVFKSEPPFSGVIPEEWQNWTGGRINEQKFNLYFMRVHLQDLPDPALSLNRINCFIENTDFDCSRWLNSLKANFLQEEKKGSVSPWSSR